MWKKLIAGTLLLFAILATVGWFNRETIILKAASSFGKAEVGPNVPIDWQQGPAKAASSPDRRAPNIIFILVDDFGINDLSLFGGGVAGGRIKTPNIDRLAQEGALFQQAYAGAAICAPSRAMLMTGRYPTRTGFEFTPMPDGMGRIVSMVNNAHETGLPPMEFNGERSDGAPDYQNQGLPGAEVTVAEQLQQAGYHTVHIGKWHLGRSTESRPTAQGFDESLLMASGMYLPPDSPEVVNARLSFDPIDKFLWARMQYAASYNSGSWFEPGGYLTDYWTDESLRVIDANKNRPFFLYLAHWGLHTPLQATRQDFDAVGDIQPHRLRVYAAMVRALDRSVGRILAKLDETGLTDNTLIVFSSDNGGPGYIGLPNINKPYRGWKVTLFEGGIRVPLFMKWPARIPAGQKIEQPVAHIDVMPTLVSAAGGTLPSDRQIDGRNLLPAAMGAGHVTRPDDAIFWQSGYYRVVRAGNWKLQVNGKQEKSWMFNLADDPTEQTNLADTHTEKLAELTALLDRHHADARPPLYPYTLEAPVAIDKTLAERIQPGDEYVIWPN